MTIRTLAVGNSNTDQLDHRSLITALTATSGAVEHKVGLFPSNPLPAAISNVSAMTAGVGPFKAILPNQNGFGQFLVQSDAVINVNFDPGEASVSRVDRIIVRVYNDDQDGSGQSDVFVEYLKGQASGSATAMPDGSLLLWEVSVPAGASSGSGGINFASTAADNRVYTTASGGMITFATTAEMNAFTDAYEGMAAHVANQDTIYVFDGSLWRVRGQVSVTSSSALSGIVNPWDGLLVTTRDTNIVYQYNGSSWVSVGYPDIASAWTTYTPTWIGSISNPSIGNGTLTGAYKRIGSTVFFRIRLTVGSTTSFGSGSYSLSLPLPVIDEQPAAAIFRDNSSATEFSLTAWLQSGTTILHIVNSSGQQVNPSVPVVWANVDRLEIAGVYETS